MIIQGANEPIILTFGVDMSGLQGFSAGLYRKANGTMLKHWTKDNAVFGEPMDDGEGGFITQVELPLSEDETLDFPFGTAVLEVKWQKEGGDIWIAERQEIHVQRSFDSTGFNNG